MINDQLRLIIETYQDHGQIYAGELLLAPEMALVMLNDLVAAKIYISGLSTWTIVPAGIMETINGFSYGPETVVSAEQAALQAQEDIKAHLDPGTVYVSFVFGDQWQ